MVSILKHFLDAVFPPRPEERVLGVETPETFSRLYRPHSLSSGTALSRYEDQLIRSAITENKFHNNTHAARLLSSLLVLWIKTHTQKPIVLVPIPLGRKRQRERGYNQVHRVIDEVIKVIPAVTIAELLERTTETAPQVTLGRTERLQNMRKAFTLKNSAKLTTFSGAHIVIVDDVLTTGATLEAARSALVHALPTDTALSTLALAH